MSVRKLPLAQRPREKALRNGLDALSDGELLALILETGTKGESVIGLSARLLEEKGGLDGIANLPPAGLFTKGISKAKALRLGACFNLAQRAWRLKVLEEPLNTAQKTYRYIGRGLENAHLEQAGAVFLASDLRPKGLDFFVNGSKNSCVFDLKTIVVKATTLKAKYLILFHYHPSLSSKPSPLDMETTKNIQQSLMLLGINVLDHLIITDRTYYSMREKTDFPFKKGD